MTFPPIPLKFVIYAVAIAGVVFAAYRYVENERVEAYDAGVADTIEQYRETVAENDRLNRKLEAAAQAGADKVGERLEEKLDQMNTRNEARVETIERVIVEHPEMEACTVPADILEIKNAIRGEVP